MIFFGKLFGGGSGDAERAEAKPEPKRESKPAVAKAEAKPAPNKENALKLMEFLASHEGQEIYAEQVFEYPIGPGTEPSGIVSAFGPIKPDTLPLEEIAANRKAASELVDKVGFDAGPSS